MKIEYEPLLKSGIKEINVFGLDEYFLAPFKEQERRKYLIDRLKVFLEEFTTLNIEAEVWIDGSFATRKEEPEDVDLVFLLRRADVDGLTVEKQMLFRRLIIEREKVKLKYGCDVYMVDKDDQQGRENKIDLFGTDSSGLNTKGFFSISIKSY